MYVKTSIKNEKLLKKYFKYFKKLNIESLNIKKNQIIFLDFPKLNKRIYNKLNTGNLICYGKNNYFNHSKIIIPFGNNIEKNRSIFYSITDNKFSKVKYESLNKLFFFIYLSTKFQIKFLNKILLKIRGEFSNKIFIYFGNKNINFLSKQKNIKIIKNLNQNYLTNNMIYIGNIGSGGIDRAIKGTFSFTFSKNENEIQIYKSIKKYHKNLFYFKSQNKFDYKNIEIKLKILKKFNFPIKSSQQKNFENNNLKLKQKVVSLSN